MMALAILTVGIRAEVDVVASRQRARQIASICGFTVQDQARVATAVSELARHVYEHGACGKAHFQLEDEAESQVLLIRIDVTDCKSGTPAFAPAEYGAGAGFTSARRLMERCEVIFDPERGTSILMAKRLPKGSPLLTPSDVARMVTQLAPMSADLTLSEVQQQNQELVNTLEELKARQDELLQLTRELEDTNRGIVALYAELEENAERLRHNDEMKSRFLSNMSHELRTPLKSMITLSDLLLNRTDGELSPEQEKQVAFIHQGATQLSDLVNDLLDMAKIEAGKIDIRPARFEINGLFSTLRGMLRPLVGNSSIQLIFRKAHELDALHSDEDKVAQVLRNFIANALKFTEAGDVQVEALPLPSQTGVRFSVTDTGIGIAAEHHELIFEEFSQIPNRLQRRSKGTGLGLPLCRKLATLLGGQVGVESAPGKGAKFWLDLPLRATPDADVDARATGPIDKPAGARSMPNPDSCS